MSGFLELKDVHKTYQMGEVRIKALDGINFTVEKGEFVIIAGPSGAGKSTILNILGGHGYGKLRQRFRRRAGNQPVHAKAINGLPALRYRFRIPVLQPRAKPDSHRKRGTRDTDMQRPFASPPLS